MTDLKPGGEYRTGNHWGVTIVREGVQPYDASGHRSDAELVAVVTNGDRDLAERICALLNGEDYDQMPEPCQPIGCDGGYHLPGCPYAAIDDGDTR